MVGPVTRVARRRRGWVVLAEVDIQLDRLTKRIVDGHAGGEIRCRLGVGRVPRWRHGGLVQIPANGDAVGGLGGGGRIADLQIAEKA